MFPLPPAVLGLLIANVGVYLLQMVIGDEQALAFALWPLAGYEDAPSQFGLWQVVTYSFLHGGSAHLLFNMLGLVTFGTPIERVGGARRLLSLYFAAVITAAITQLIVPPWLGAAPHPTIGASGGVFGLLLAYAVLFPRSRVIPLVPPIPMPAWLFATLYTVVELYLGVAGRLEGVAHFAHLGGLVGSAIVLWQWRRRRR